MDRSGIHGTFIESPALDLEIHFGRIIEGLAKYLCLGISYSFYIRARRLG